MKLNTVGSLLIALVLVAFVAPALDAGGSTVDPEKPAAAPCAII